MAGAEVQVQPPDLVAVQAELGLDERAVKGLSDLQPSDQVIVIDIVSNKHSCNNASAFTWATVRKMKENPSQLKLEYLRRHLDERAQESLGKLPQPVQEAVASQVDVLKLRNLSAFVWKQIRIQQEKQQQQGPMMYGPGPGHPMQMQMGMPMMPMMAMPRGSVLQSQMAGGGARDRSRTPGGLSAQIAHLRSNLAVGGSLDSGRGGGGLSAQIAHLRSTLGGGGRGGGHGPMPEMDVSTFIMHSGLDSNAAQALTALDAGSQRMVVALTQKQAARNPSAVTWSMVKMVREKPLEAKMEYLRVVMDSEAVAALERLSPEEQEMIVSKVDVGNCRNISAFVWSRVKAVMATTGGGAGAEASSSPAGRPLALPPGPVQARANGMQGNYGADDSEPIDPVAFAGVELDERCLSKLRELPRHQAEALLTSLPAACRNPSAYIWSKIKGKV